MERLKGKGVEEWLNQHLTSPWDGHQTVASELGNDIIANIRERWTQLSVPVRLGVLFSLISLKKAQQLQLKDKCQELIDNACADPNEWVRLVSHMFMDYPSEGTLRFSVEQFADQANLGPLMDKLSNNISQDGIKFHPKEFAYLNDSVCREAQGKDPRTKTYPPLTGPSLLQHFKLRESHRPKHAERAGRLRKMAEQTPTVAMAAGNLSSVGFVAPGPTSVESSSPTTAGAGVGNGVAAASQTSGQPGPPGLPRPTKSTSSGLFVSRKPAGSFVRNNAPRPMSLARNPSTGQLPLRSPRLDGPPTPRLNQKTSRIQILDIQEGTEIMQSMNDAKIRKEQAEQREKELKKEQRALEMEAKRQQDAEKKAQLLKEKEDKKREREEAKKLKEKQKHEREEQAQKDRERRNSEKELELALMRDEDDDDEEEGSLATPHIKKRQRLSNSRRGSRDDDDDDYDNEQHDRSGEPLSPTTGFLGSRPSAYDVQDDDQPMSMERPSSSDQGSNLYFSSNTQGQLEHQQTDTISSDLAYASIFEATNLLTKEDRAYITAFLQGHPVIRPNGNETHYQIVMNQEQVQDVTGKTMWEIILIEMNFATGEWRKIKRKRPKPYVPAPASSSEVAQ
ncbi:Negative elongation factor A [Modicella reniformis]|uniref:Negative elongation factor A n=1 Tax=Modicella reniformis TaxID=1440133 RepID=A0A9P6IKB2_9FUNG|nr:Negative elongation factor A [Modicella reniformis]